jgi:hypothetical protein
MCLTVSKTRKYRGFEACLNELLQSCIPDGDTKLISFAHNENEEAILKYDLRSKSAESFHKFCDNMYAMFQKIAEKSDGYFSASDSRVMLGRDALPEWTPFIQCGQLCVGFDFLECNNDIVYFCELHMLPAAEAEFVTAYRSAIESRVVLSEEVDDTIYKDEEWCWGERFEIDNTGIKYIGVL